MALKLLFLSRHPVKSPVRTDSPTKMRKPRLRQRGALLLFYQPNVCGTDIAVAIHIRAEVRAVDMLAL